MDPYCNTPYHILRFIFFGSTCSMSWKWSVAFRLSTKVLYSYLPPSPYVQYSLQSHSSYFDYPISAPSSLQIMKILIMQYFPFSFYVHPIIHKHHISGHSQVGLYVLAFMCETNCCPRIKQWTELNLNSTVGWFSVVCSDALMFRFDT